MRRFILSVLLLSCLGFAQTAKKIPTMSGATPTPGNCVEWKGSSAIGDAGKPCGSGDGTGGLDIDATGTNGDLFKAKADANATDSPNLSGNEASHYGYGLLVRKTTTANAVLNYTRGAIGAYCAALAGGINRGSDEPGGWFKANYQCMGVTGTWRTPGQHAIMGASGNHYSIGDHFGFTTILTDWGGGSANGDESTQGFAARLYEGEQIFSATVASVSGDTINFSNGTALDTLGEGRYLLNLSRTHSTGTVASVSGNVFTFSGAGLATKYGAGNKTNLCLALDANTMTIGSTPHKLVNLVTNIADDNTLTIKWGLPEQNGTYPTKLATTGTYTMYACSPVTYVGVSYQPGVTSGSVKVADPSVFSATDSIELPVWYQHRKNTFTGYISHSGYNGGSLAYFSDLSPTWTRNGMVLSGNIERGIEVLGTVGNYGVMFNKSVGSNVSMIYDVPPTGATTYGRRFLQTTTGQGNGTYLAFQQDPDNGGYWYAGRVNSAFTIGEKGIGINLAPQANQRLAVKFAEGESVTFFSAAGPTSFSINNAGDLYAAGKLESHDTNSVTVNPSDTGTAQAITATNNGTGVARNALHVYGNFQRGLEFSDGTIDTYGITFNKVLGDGTPFIQDVPQTGATTHNRKFFASVTGQGNQTYFGFQQQTGGGYWYAGRTNSAFTIGEGGIGIGAAPQANTKVAVITSATTENGIAIWNSGSVKASISGDGVITATKLTGITDTAVVTNLNADQVDGKSAIDFTAAPVAAPASATATCTAGQWSYATGYVYVCVATNTWQRASLTTW